MTIFNSFNILKLNKLNNFVNILNLTVQKNDQVHVQKCSINNIYEFQQSCYYDVKGIVPH
ncbi:hypothetical protein DDB_G0268752 [Dictyostelium discoideum AX4]|uniref:Uncharacterized protein n=1 Tax=Dictyostelium discoideum TaxID=44689 RepID=Q55EU2_DICDI|nr:hypothetical protein DDB_G0268752 [Dictyostelium discoideum AX4]EAL72965.1 hypothetical protein DDB_G0268752 [Dictyostelium discoideum AX4]|eukprot:XP_646928.1 hypothetical protein DDB_G0268752 [Dictyostelium discoideum AX4]